MLSRRKMILAIRDKIEEMYKANRFAVVREIMGGVDRFNFSGVPDQTVGQIYRELCLLSGEE